MYTDNVVGLWPTYDFIHHIMITDFTCLELKNPESEYSHTSITFPINERPRSKLWGQFYIIWVTIYRKMVGSCKRYPTLTTTGMLTALWL
jgi:hypothetical protein